MVTRLLIMGFKILWCALSVDRVCTTFIFKQVRTRRERHFLCLFVFSFFSIYTICTCFILNEMRKLDRVGHAVKRMYKLDHDSSSVSVLVAWE